MPVKREILSGIMERASRSPSYRNSQPWEVFIVTGEKKVALAEKLTAMISDGVPLEPDFPFAQSWPPPMESRTESHRRLRFAALGIDPDRDHEKIVESYMCNFKFFDAPGVIFIGMDRSLGPWSVFDLGLFTHGLLLAIYDAGLGACPQAMPTAYPKIIRGILDIPENFAIMLAISFGYPDSSAPANSYRSVRKGQKEFVHWYGFGHANDAR
jgi:nitroreductase